ncbi:MAG TPA: hypothetical protein VLT82_04480 [Myxococcaceae bacterium]|nr:hypothetical protein [Myxococcaceae bacterium]
MLFLSGELPSTLQAWGPRLDNPARFDWSAGRPILDGLLEELSMPRVGGDAIVELLLQILVVQALRIQVTYGFGKPRGVDRNG